MTTSKATSGDEDYAAFKLEQRGIDLVPDDERVMRPSGLFWLWAGAIWNVEFLVYGALIMSFGLSFPQAVFAILVGNVFYVVLGVASLQGPETGTTAFMVSRAPFGKNGNRSVSFFNWLTQVGFEVEGLVLIVLVVEAMFSKGGITAGTGLKIVIILVAVALQFIIPFLGHATITKVLRYLSFVFIVVFAIMAILVIPHVNLNDLAASRIKSKQPVSAGWQVITTAIVLLISAGGLGWTENANDYSRYLPRETPMGQTFWAATLGAAIPSILLELLGAAAYVISPNAAAVTGVPSSFASWFFWPFLILALCNMDMYPDVEALRDVCRGFEGIVAARERGVQPHHPRLPGCQKALVFSKSPAGAVRSVAICHPVAAHRSHPDPRTRIRDDLKRPFDAPWALVVVDDGCRARFERF